MDALGVLISQGDKDRFFVGQEVLFNRYKEMLPAGTRNISPAKVKPSGIFLIIRRNEGFVYRVIPGATIRRNRNRITEILDARKKYGGKK